MLPDTKPLHITFYLASMATFRPRSPVYLKNWPEPFVNQSSRLSTYSAANIHSAIVCPLGISSIVGGVLELHLKSASQNYRQGFRRCFHRPPHYTPKSKHNHNITSHDVHTTDYLNCADGVE